MLKAQSSTCQLLRENSFLPFSKVLILIRVCTGPGKPGKSWKFKISKSRSGKPGKYVLVLESPRKLDFSWDSE